MPWAGGTPTEGKAQARRAAQAQRRQENGGRVQVSGGARKKARVRVWRVAAGGRPQGGRGRALPTRDPEGQRTQDDPDLLTERHAALHAVPPSEETETFGGALMKPNAARACKLDTRVCGAHLYLL